MIDVQEDDLDILKKSWADFHLFVTFPAQTILAEPKIILPEWVPESDEEEYVEPIAYYGDHWSTSKDMLSGGFSMWKLYCTIEKIIGMLDDLIQKEGWGSDTEVQVAIFGYLSAKRKAFESIINLSTNVVVMNFDPDENDEWGKRYIRNVKYLSDHGFGYPASAPRKETYRRNRHSKKTSMRRP